MSVTAATEILDAEGEAALTLRALTVRLATGYGAIYHHVADRDDLLAAAADHVIARIAGDLAADAEPRQALRAVAAGLFDAFVAHPWVGAQLTREPWRPALLDIHESVSRQLQALDEPPRALSDSAGVLANYILGVAGQNAANAALGESISSWPGSRPCTVLAGQLRLAHRISASCRSAAPSTRKFTEARGPAPVR